MNDFVSVLASCLPGNISSTRKINISGFFCSTSYGLVALNVVKALTEIGCEVSIFPFSFDGSDIPEQFLPSIQKSLENAQYWDVNAPSVNIVHQNMMTMFAGHRRIGWPIFELDRFTDHELHHLRSLDQIIVCSQWAKKVCREAGLTQRIDVVPLGVDISIFYPSYESRSDGPTIFISAGKKELRKCHDKLYQYFDKAFTPDDNVELWMVWSNRILDQRNPRESLKWDHLYQSSKMAMAGKVKLFNWLPSQKDLADLLRKADCYLGLSRAEGWNLNLLEAMAVGLPCITNTYAGHTEFFPLQSLGNYTVPYRVSELAYDGTWFFGTGDWMAFEEPEDELVVNYLREVHEGVQLNEFGPDCLNIEQARQFSWKNTAEKLLEVVNV